MTIFDIIQTQIKFIQLLQFIAYHMANTTVDGKKWITSGLQVTGDRD